MFKAIRINPERINSRLNELAEFGRNEQGGWSRFSYSYQYLKARDLVKKWMIEAGMNVRTDAIGNLIGRLEGTDENAPVVSAGSHIDTVKYGGKYDGTVGVIGALEVAQTIKENNIQHRHPIEIITFVEEEGSCFNIGNLGSKAMCGLLTKEMMYTAKNVEGKTLAEILESVGLDPEKIDEAKVGPNYYKAFFELHIEQGAILDSLGIKVGIVQGIAGLVWLKVTINGRADHAGATPMNLRKDAMLVASEIIVAAEKIAKEVGDHTVITVGNVDVYPGSINIVPGKVEMTFDIRDISEDKRNKAVELISKAIQDICKKRNMDYSIIETSRIAPCLSSPFLKSLIVDSAKEEGVVFYDIVSGAGHDAQLMARLTDMAMIFCPSIHGLSHCPTEYTDLADIVTCTQVLFNTFLKII
jgi:allantoate deiminase